MLDASVILRAAQLAWSGASSLPRANGENAAGNEVSTYDPVISLDTREPAFDDSAARPSPAPSRRPRAGRILGWTAALALAVALPGGAATARQDVFPFQLHFPPAPADGRAAALTMPDRSNIVVTFLACQNELTFLNLFRDLDEKENILGRIIAKMQWLHLNAPSFVGTGNHPSACAGDAILLRRQDVEKDDWEDLRHNQGRNLNAEIARPDRFGAVCHDVITSVSVPPPGGFVSVKYQVSGDCMKAQINRALVQMGRQDQFGSSDLPCNGDFLFVAQKTKGEWDITVRDLIRVLYLNDRDNVLSKVGTVDVARYVREQLVSLDIDLSEDTYGLWGCGDTERSQGSPQDRIDEHNWINGALDAIGDAASWLARHWFLILFFVLIGALGGSIENAFAGYGGALTATAIAFYGAPASMLVRIPETENHRLMIESSRFLNNQMMIREMRAGNGDPSEIEAAQVKVRQWLLNKMQSILRQEFSEYNARPYERYSLVALLNLYDFTGLDEPAVKTAAQMVLEYSMAKFAAGSSQSRRLAPYRRRMEVIREAIEGLPGAREPGLLDQSSGSDYAVSLGLLFSGQSPQTSQLVTTSAAEDMIYAAASSFVPHQLILDLMIRRDTPLYQRLQHGGGYEIYSSSRSYLITAGGAQAPPANTATLFGASLPMAYDNNDLGAAVPTTLMLAVPPPLATTFGALALSEFLRIEGQRVDYNAALRTYDHNLCVWNGFACGLNIQLSADFQAASHCPGERVLGPFPSQPEWLFIDSKSCAPYSGGPPFYLAIYRQSCPNQDYGCRDNFGLFEIVDAPTTTFTAFESATLANNPPGFVTAKMTGTYTSASNHRIKFDCAAHQRRHNRSGIEEIDGVQERDIDKWSFAEGDGISADGRGVVTIWNVRTGQQLLLDFSGALPARTCAPGPCPL